MGVRLDAAVGAIILDQELRPRERPVVLGVDDSEGHGALACVSPTAGEVVPAKDFSSEPQAGRGACLPARASGI